MDDENVAAMNGPEKGTDRNQIGDPTKIVDIYDETTPKFLRFHENLESVIEEAAVSFPAGMWNPYRDATVEEIETSLREDGIRPEYAAFAAREGFRRMDAQLKRQGSRGLKKG